MYTRAVAFKTNHAKIGKIDASGTRLGYFAGYTECEHCGNPSRVCLDTDDVHILSTKLGLGIRRREPIGLKITKKLIKHYDMRG